MNALTSVAYTAHTLPVKSLTIAIIGCGRMGAIRAKMAQQLQANIAYVCDTHLALATRLASLYPGCSTVETPFDLPWDQLDAIFICTPPAVRMDVISLAIVNKVAFFIEKPLAMHLSDVEFLIKALESNPLITAVGYMNRYRPAIMQVKALLNKQQVLGFSCHWVCSEYLVPWWKDSHMSGGAINEQATHLIDLVRYLMGDIQTIYPVGNQLEKSQTLALALQCNNGILGTVFYTCLAHKKDIAFKIFTDTEIISLSGWDFRLENIDAVNAAIEVSDKEHIFYSETEAFFTAVMTKNKKWVLCDFFESCKTQAVIDQIREELVA